LTVFIDQTHMREQNYTAHIFSSRWATYSQEV
jgi:hypothetical protein